jgi:CRISPR-associated protein Csd2
VDAFSRRVALVAVFGVIQGNPNGDPDTANLPRRDSADRVITSGESLKRKIRDAVAAMYPDDPRLKIFIARGAVLERALRAAVVSSSAAAVRRNKAVREAERPAKKREGSAAPPERADQATARQAVQRIIAEYWDVRAFGAVLGIGVLANAVDGAVRGPVQVAPGMSIAPERPVDMSMMLARVAVATEAESEAQGGVNRTFGRRYGVEHAIIVQRIDVNPFDAKRTGFTDADYDVLLESLTHCFDLSNASGRRLTMEALYEIEASSKFGGGAMLHVDRLVEAIPLVEVPASPADYEIRLNLPTKAPGIASLRTLIAPYRPPIERVTPTATT